MSKDQIVASWIEIAFGILALIFVAGFPLAVILSNKTIAIVSTIGLLLCLTGVMFYANCNQRPDQ